jgi:hypothetical protein
LGSKVNNYPYELVDDHLDALLCSLVGRCPDSVRDTSLLYQEEQYHKRIPADEKQREIVQFKPFNGKLPDGYRLLQSSYWDEIIIKNIYPVKFLPQHKDANKWCKEWSTKNEEELGLKFESTKINYRKQVKWVCEKHGREWDQAVDYRIKNPTNGCPTCKKELKKKNGEGKLEE